MQIGVVPLLSPHSGGIYQYSQNILLSLYHSNTEDSFYIFAEDTGKLGVFGDSNDRWKVHSLEPLSVRSLARKYARRLVGTEMMQNLWEPIPRGNHRPRRGELQP
jgi:hypothetical protein